MSLNKKSITVKRILSDIKEIKSTYNPKIFVLVVLGCVYMAPILDFALDYVQDDVEEDDDHDNPEQKVEHETRKPILY